MSAPVWRFWIICWFSTFLLSIPCFQFVGGVWVCLIGNSLVPHLLFRYAFASTISFLGWADFLKPKASSQFRIIQSIFTNKGSVATLCRCVNIRYPQKQYTYRDRKSQSIFWEALFEVFCNWSSNQWCGLSAFSARVLSAFPFLNERKLCAARFSKFWAHLGVLTTQLQKNVCVMFTRRGAWNMESVVAFQV